MAVNSVPSCAPPVMVACTRNGSKSSSVAKKNWLSRVNSAWWALPSGVKPELLAGSVAAKSVSAMIFGACTVGSVTSRWT